MQVLLLVELKKFMNLKYGGPVDVSLVTCRIGPYPKNQHPIYNMRWYVTTQGINTHGASSYVTS